MTIFKVTLTEKMMYNKLVLISYFTKIIFEL
jgi:hypothetical protein